jgi:hypothetical protein
MLMTSAACVACQRQIDGAARMCPYCGANPVTGAKVDTQAVLQEIFRPRDMTTSETVIEYARERQGIVIAISIIVGFLILAGMHAFVKMRNASAVTSAPAVPLTEVTDNWQPRDDAELPIPDLKFQYDGDARRMRTFIVEPGAVTPPEVIAAQQAAQAAAQPAPQPAPPPPAQ